MAFLLCCHGGELSLAAEEALATEAVATTAGTTESSVFTTEGLSAQEVKKLEQQTKYKVRGKSMLEEPSIVTPFTAEPSIDPLDTKALSEEERLYRYFGIASILYETGKFEEAIEILEYILSKKPRDEYVKRYLNQIRGKLSVRNVKWRATSRKSADILKKIRLKELMDDGVAYYKQKQFDEALLKFSDVLTLDPDNAIAKRHIAQLKKHYRSEARIESIVKEWETTPSGKEIKDTRDSSIALREKDITSEIEENITELLDKADLKQRGVLSVAEKFAEKLLDEKEIKDKMKNVQTASLMNKVELDLKISEIIGKKKLEARRNNSYTLGPGDELRIDVQDHAEMSGKTTVSPAGVVVLPLVNEPVEADGLTVKELRGKITDILKKYVKNPIAYVGIATYKSKIFYVIDETGCTPYTITRAKFTLRDALFMSDWGANRALGRVIIMKPDKLYPVVKKVDAFDIVYRGNLSKNIRIESGDVIYIPLTAASKITTTISDALSPFQAIRDVKDEWLEQRWNQAAYANLPRIPRNAEMQTIMDAGTTEEHAGD